MVAMDKTVILNIIVDKCSLCHGVWLDGGELDLLKKAIEFGASGDFALGLSVGMAMWNTG
jgi:Zn-finger nucleic acid-binding protein